MTSGTRQADVLRNFVEDADEAMWCIDFLEPVELDRGEYEVIRQVFENRSRWGFCNQAFRRLYDIPSAVDVAAQPVSLYFGRNPENEEFIRRLVASDFALDSVPSSDTRHDGTVAHMENRVRADIGQGRLLRLWGTVRDVTQASRTRRALADRSRDVQAILSALPDAVLVTDARGRLIAANDSVERLFGVAAENWLGRAIHPVLGFGSEGDFLALAGQSRWSAQVLCGDGSRLACDVHLAPLDSTLPERLVLSVRPVAPRSRRRQPRRPPTVSR